MWGRNNRKVGVDLKLGSEDDLPKALDCLAERGVCVIEVGDCGLDLKAAAEEAQKLPQSIFRSAPRAPGINAAEALVGPEGSAQLVELETANDHFVADGNELVALPKINELAQELFSGLAMLGHEVLGNVGFASSALLLEARTPGCGRPKEESFSEESASQWLELFMRHRLQFLFFLGPRTGVLELGLFGGDESSVVQVPTRPGLVVLLRPDLVWRKHVAQFGGQGRCFVYSSFMLSSNVPRVGSITTNELQAVPYTWKLLNWCIGRLEQLKEADLHNDEAALEGIPKEWLRTLDSEFAQGEQACVRGWTCRLPGPSSWSPDGLILPTFAGADFVEEIPHTRFDIEEMYYEDPEQDQWRNLKTYSRHCTYVDGAHLFDNKFFGMPDRQVASAPISERFGLEVGYEALHCAGYTKQSLRRLKGDVLVGQHVADQQQNFLSKETAIFGPAGSQAKEANLLSFYLNLIGQSITMDTDGSSSLAALAHAHMEHSIYEDEDDHSRLAPFSLVMGSAWNIAPGAFANFCFRRLLTPKGRCFTFNEDASGFIRGEGWAALVISRLFGTAEKRSEGVPSTNGSSGENHILLRSVESMQSARGSSLTAPAADAMQEVIELTLQRGGCARPGDIDFVECHAPGESTADFFEAVACQRTMRKAGEDKNLWSLPMTSFKTSVGNTYAAAGLIGLVRAAHCARWDMLAPNNMLQRINPHIDGRCTEVIFPTEALAVSNPHHAASGLLAINSFGSTGTNVTAVMLVSVGDARTPLPLLLPRPKTWSHVEWATEGLPEGSQFAQQGMHGTYGAEEEERDTSSGFYGPYRVRENAQREQPRLYGTYGI
eukprot:TRINITY_DN4830_c0_g2_i1.p1 TRINITY_DN4830_c0_g2~~TRINITY_DN4830_c0_g2_i1.p1  ORF type:complete len:832 (-),score=133.99 TRINITY_DN4830_c0_g2_i1:212-2707(-)